MNVTDLGLSRNHNDFQQLCNVYGTPDSVNNGSDWPSSKVMECLRLVDKLISSGNWTYKLAHSPLEHDVPKFSIAMLQKKYNRVKSFSLTPSRGGSWCATSTRLRQTSTAFHLFPFTGETNDKDYHKFYCKRSTLLLWWCFQVIITAILSTVWTLLISTDCIPICGVPRAHGHGAKGKE